MDTFTLRCTEYTTTVIICQQSGKVCHRQTEEPPVFRQLYAGKCKLQNHFSSLLTDKSS